MKNTNVHAIRAHVMTIINCERYAPQSCVLIRIYACGYVIILQAFDTCRLKINGGFLCECHCQHRGSNGITSILVETVLTVETVCLWKKIETVTSFYSRLVTPSLTVG